MAYHENREYPTDLPITAVRFHNMDFLAHWHTEVEYVLVLEGQLGVGINTGYRILEAGDMAMFASGDIHYYDSKENDSTILIIVFRPEIIDNIIDLTANPNFSNIIISKPLIASANLSEAVLTEMKNCFEAIFTELNSQKDEYKTLIKARLIELAGLFLRYRPRMTDNSTEIGRAHV